MEAHVFTDGQKTSHARAVLRTCRLARNKLIVHSVARQPEPNWYVEA